MRSVLVTVLSIIGLTIVMAGLLTGPCLAQIDVLDALTRGMDTEDAASPDEVSEGADGEETEEEFIEDDQNVREGYVNAEVGLNVRTGPGVGNSRIGALTVGARVTVLEERDGWYRISFNGQEGWVSGEYITLTDKEKGRSKFKFGDGDGIPKFGKDQPRDSSNDSDSQDDGPGSPPDETGNVPQSAEAAHVYQFNGTSLDCGPSCALIMGRLTGLEAPGGADSATLPRMRELMGADATGCTSFYQVQQGITAMGGSSFRANNASLDELGGYVGSGQPLMLLGRPNGDSWSNPSVNGGTVNGREGGVDHFVVVSGRDGDNWVINDPALRDPIVVSTAQLKAFRDQCTQGALGMVVNGGN